MTLNDFLKKRKIYKFLEGHSQCNSEQTKLLKELVSNKNIKNVLEIGFNAGHSSETFLSTNKDVKVLSIDLGVYKYVNIGKYYNTKVMYLSSGETKKLELLRLIIEQKKLWVLDEPYNHLDEFSIEVLNQTFVDHINNGGMIIFASHFNPNLSNLKTIEFE